MISFLVLLPPSPNGWHDCQAEIPGSMPGATEIFVRPTFISLVRLGVILCLVCNRRVSMVPAIQGVRNAGF